MAWTAESCPLIKPRTKWKISFHPGKFMFERNCFHSPFFFLSCSVDFQQTFMKLPILDNLRFGLSPRLHIGLNLSEDERLVRFYLRLQIQQAGWLKQKEEPVRDGTQIQSLQAGVAWMSRTHWLSFVLCEAFTSVDFQFYSPLIFGDSQGVETSTPNEWICRKNTDCSDICKVGDINLLLCDCGSFTFEPEILFCSLWFYQREHFIMGRGAGDFKNVLNEKNLFEFTSNLNLIECYNSYFGNS